jgi:hypothetical protein
VKEEHIRELLKKIQFDSSVKFTVQKIAAWVSKANSLNPEQAEENKEFIHSNGKISIKFLQSVTDRHFLLRLRYLEKPDQNNDKIVLLSFF